MEQATVSRRKLLAVGTAALLVSASLPEVARAATPEKQDQPNEELIRNWYDAWKRKDLATFDALLADDFTFTSAAGDDHISKSKFKTQCWDTQINFIDHFDLERISASADDAFVKYLCYTK